MKIKFSPAKLFKDTPRRFWLGVIGLPLLAVFLQAAVYVASYYYPVEVDTITGTNGFRSLNLVGLARVITGGYNSLADGGGNVLFGSTPSNNAACVAGTWDDGGDHLCDAANNAFSAINPVLLSLQWGLNPNGSTDNTARFAAIMASPTATNGNLFLCFTPGKYETGTVVLPNAAVTLCSNAGPALTTIQLKNGAAAFSSLIESYGVANDTSSGDTGINIFGLSLDGNAANNPGDAIATVSSVSGNTFTVSAVPTGTFYNGCPLSGYGGLTVAASSVVTSVSISGGAGTIQSSQSSGNSGSGSLVCQSTSPLLALRGYNNYVTNVWIQHAPARGLAITGLSADGTCIGSGKRVGGGVIEDVQITFTGGAGIFSDNCTGQTADTQIAGLQLRGQGIATGQTVSRMNCSALPSEYAIMIARAAGWKLRGVRYEGDNFLCGSGAINQGGNTTLDIEYDDATYITGNTSGAVVDWSIANGSNPRGNISLTIHSYHSNAAALPTNGTIATSWTSEQISNSVAGSNIIANNTPFQFSPIGGSFNGYIVPDTTVGDLCYGQGLLTTVPSPPTIAIGTIINNAGLAGGTTNITGDESGSGLGPFCTAQSLTLGSSGSPVGFTQTSSITGTAITYGGSASATDPLIACGNSYGNGYTPPLAANIVTCTTPVAVGYVAKTNTANVTMTGANMTASPVRTVVNMTGTLTAGHTVSFDTAANILAAMPTAEVGTTFEVRVINSSSANFAWTLATVDSSVTAAGWTNGTTTVAQNAWRDFSFAFTNVTSGSVAGTMTYLGSGTY